MIGEGRAKQVDSRGPPFATVLEGHYRWGPVVAALTLARSHARTHIDGAWISCLRLQFSSTVEHILTRPARRAGVGAGATATAVGAARV